MEKGYLYWLFRELLDFLVAMKQSVLVFFDGEEHRKLSIIAEEVWRVNIL